MPLTWENTARGPAGYDLTPTGMRLAPGGPLPTIVDPIDPMQPAGYGPMSASWAERRRLLRGLDPSAIDGKEPSVPDAFAWSYFHAAPADQRCGFLEGNEWLVLEGLHPTHPRLESQLPGARAVVRAVGLDAKAPRELPLRADTLAIDGARGICTITWRGNIDLADTLALQSVRLYAGLELPGRPIDWPMEAAVDRPPPSVPSRAQLDARIAAHRATIAFRHPSATTPEVDARGHVAPAASGPVEAEPVPDRLSTTTPSADGPESPRRERAPTVDYLHAADRMPSRLEEPDPNSSTQIRVAAEWVEYASPTSAPSPIGSASPPAGRPRTATRIWSASIEPMAVSPEAHTVDGPVDRFPTPTAKASPVDERAALADASMETTQTGLYDEPTYDPGPEELQGLATQAEARRRVETLPPPSLPEPPVERRRIDLRALRSTVRGIGLRAIHSAAQAARPGPSLDARPTEEELTRNLPVPEALLELARHNDAATPPPETVARPAPFARATLPPPSMDRSELPAEPLPLGPMQSSALQSSALQSSALQSSALQSSALPLVSTVLVSSSAPEEEEELPPETRATFALPFEDDASRGELEVDLAETRKQVQERLERGESLAGTDLSDLDLDGFDLSERCLSGARLDRASLRGADLSGADLVGASLEGAVLENALLDRARLGGANLVGAHLLRASFRGADLTDANLTTADAREAMFESATGDRVVFSRARLDRASLECVQFYGADLSEAFLTGASLEGAILPEANGRELVATGARLSRALLEYARLEAADFGGALLDQVDATGAVFDQAVLEGADLTGATIESASFVGTDLSSAKLAGVHARDARFDRAKLVGADLRDAELDGASLDEADVRNAKMD
jgi:uncharacterized protein YjbI with pentapeptide repeats